MTTMMTTTFTHRCKPHPMDTAIRLPLPLLLLLLALTGSSYFLTTTVNAQSNVTINSGLPPVFFLNVPNGAKLTCSPSGNEFTFRSSVGRIPISANTTIDANGTAVDEIVWGPCNGGGDDDAGGDGDGDDDCTVIVPLGCTTCTTTDQQPCSPSPVQQGSTACTITSRNEGETVNISADFDGFDPLCSNFMAQL
jgi:hypothetical protein